MPKVTLKPGHPVKPGFGIREKFRTEFRAMTVTTERSEERRRYPRQRVFKAGTIAFNRASGISCLVRNISAGGACLDVESPVGIPDDFMLMVERDHLLKACHVAWRNHHRIGVAFSEPLPAAA